jgi:hypothetical protein
MTAGARLATWSNRSSISSHREMEAGTISPASSVLNEEVELAHTVMDRGMVNNAPTTEPSEQVQKLPAAK